MTARAVTASCDPTGSLAARWMLKLEAELEFRSVLRRRSGLFDGRGVHRGGVLGNRGPVGCGELMGVLDRDVAIGDPGEGWCHVEVVDEPLPHRVIVDGVVEVTFESVCLVAPDGPTGGPGG